jgi:crossover junction endodeoxyribonuclease RusA
MITIEYPFPDAKLFPNRSHGQHWSHTSKLRKEARKQAWALSREKLGSVIVPTCDIALSIVFVQPDKPKRYRDADNLLASCKNILDGLADALKINDRMFEPIIIYRTHGKKSCVRIEIRGII